MIIPPKNWSDIKIVLFKRSIKGFISFTIAFFGKPPKFLLSFISGVFLLEKRIGKEDKWEKIINRKII